MFRGPFEALVEDATSSMQSVQSLSRQLPPKLFALLVEKRATDPYDIEAIVAIVDEYLEGERHGGDSAENETKRIA